MGTSSKRNSIEDWRKKILVLQAMLRPFLGVYEDKVKVDDDEDGTIPTSSISISAVYVS